MMEFFLMEFRMSSRNMYVENEDARVSQNVHYAGRFEAVAEHKLLMFFSRLSGSNIKTHKHFKKVRIFDGKQIKHSSSFLLNTKIFHLFHILNVQ